MVHIIKTRTIIVKYGTRKSNMGHVDTNIKQLIMNILKVKVIKKLPITFSW